MKKHFKLILILFLLTSQVQAQSIFDDDVDDEPSAPINLFIPLAITVGACLGINKLKCNNQK